MLRIFLILFIAIFTKPLAASIIKKPPAKSVETPYQQLVCTEEDRAHIYEIISTMAEHGKLSLLFKQSHLREVGARINHVHPLKFLAVVFTNPHLKSCMYYIWDDHFKRNGFLDGLGPSLTREMEKGKLAPYLHEFATEVGTPMEHIQGYFNAMDWENLVLFLIQS